ncbi:hypothetical protein [Hubei diptera virus 10]|uniref:Uncharacterized protein n=1 Tax=Hubei diptera virus 10 TaxID=1922871 RepID=A0A1L3KMY7_9RHAB|nr:hypothetical protein [Hubei diptera virus 10]APG78752.1 hypothetical protein [Hubei diptera virus 10]
MEKTTTPKKMPKTRSTSQTPGPSNKRSRAPQSSALPDAKKGQKEYTQVLKGLGAMMNERGGDLLQAHTVSDTQKTLGIDYDDIQEEALNPNVLEEEDDPSNDIQESGDAFFEKIKEEHSRKEKEDKLRKGVKIELGEDEEGKISLIIPENVNLIKSDIIQLVKDLSQMYTTKFNCPSPTFTIPNYGALVTWEKTCPVEKKVSHPPILKTVELPSTSRLQANETTVGSTNEPVIKKPLLDRYIDALKVGVHCKSLLLNGKGLTLTLNKLGLKEDQLRNLYTEHRIPKSFRKFIMISIGDNKHLYKILANFSIPIVLD